MSRARPVLNAWLRLTEKPFLTRARSAGWLRASFEFKARLFFHGPRGVGFADDVIAGVPVTHVQPKHGADRATPVVLYLHGGGYVFGSPRTHRAMLAQLSHRTGLSACLPNYRKAPEHPFPAAIEDAVAVYRALSDHPGGIVIGGDSAGGGLTLALLLEILRLGLPRPLGCFLLSPLTDLTFSTPAVRANEAADVVLPASMAATMVAMYMRDQDIEQPLASPLNGDFSGAGPVWCAVGDTEILYDNSILLVQRLRAQKVDVTLHEKRDLPHVWPLFHNLLPEARTTLDQLAGWITGLSSRSGDS